MGGCQDGHQDDRRRPELDGADNDTRTADGARRALPGVYGGPGIELGD
jgi:hypothetical protein